MAEQAGYLDTVEQGLALHPEQAATSAAQADLLFWVLVAVCVALVLTLFALVIGFSGMAVKLVDDAYYSTCTVLFAACVLFTLAT